MTEPGPRTICAGISAPARDERLSYRDRETVLAAIAERVAREPGLYDRLPRSVRWHLLRWQASRAVR